MGFLISLLAPKLGDTAAKLLVYLGVLALVLGLVWWRVDAYGDRRFKAGVDATEAKWEEASNRLKADAAKSATKADDAAAKRVEDYAQQVETEENGIAQAEQNGTSPLDVLFGG